MGSTRTGSGTSSTRTSSFPCQTTALTPGPWPRRRSRARANERPAAPRRKRRRIGAGPLPHALQQLDQGLVSAALRRPAELVSTREQSISGTPTPRSNHPGGDGCSRSARRPQRRPVPRPPVRQPVAPRRVAPAAGDRESAGRDVESPTGIGEKSTAVGVGHVVRVYGLKAQTGDIRHERDEASAKQRRRQEGAREEAAHATPASRLKMRAGRNRTIRKLGCSTSRASSRRSTSAL